MLASGDGLTEDVETEINFPNAKTADVWFQGNFAAA
jgi:hypothetical protein